MRAPVLFLAAGFALLFSAVVACGSNATRPGGVDPATGDEPGGIAGTTGTTGRSDAALPNSGGSAGSPGLSGAGGNTPPVDAGVAGGADTRSAGVDAARTTTDANMPTDVSAVHYEAGGGPLPCKAAFCENFESGTIDPAVWAKTGSPSVGTAVVYSGTKALHIPAFTGVGTHLIRASKLPGTLNKSQFGRMFLWVEQAPSPPAASTTHHWAMIEPGTLLLGGLMQSSGDTQTYLNSFPYGIDKQDKSGKDSYAPHKWSCIEWQFDVALGRARVWLNSAELTQMATDGFKTLSDLAPISFGWQEYHGNTKPWEVWIDDIALDAQRIGCDR